MEQEEEGMCGQNERRRARTKSNMESHRQHQTASDDNSVSGSWKSLNRLKIHDTKESVLFKV